VTRADFQKLAEIRIDEAEILLNAKKYAGAYYLAGYAVECALKSCIAKQSRRFEYPDKQRWQECYTHNLAKLLALSGLEALLLANSAVKLNWSIVKDWNEQCRYDRLNRAEAEAIYEAITGSADGVLPWIKSHW